jgi:hypothetical protein
MSEQPQGEHMPTSSEQLPLYVIEAQGSPGIVAQLVGTIDQAIDQQPADGADDQYHFQDIDGSIATVQRRTYDYEQTRLRPRTARSPLEGMRSNGQPTGLMMYAVTLQTPEGITTLDIARNHGDGVLTAVGKSASRGTTDMRKILPLYAGHGLEEAIEKANACVGLGFEISQQAREITQSAERQPDARATITGPEADAVQAHLEPFAEALRQTPDDAYSVQYNIKREAGDSVWRVRTFGCRRQLNTGTAPDDYSDGEVKTWVYLAHAVTDGVIMMSVERTRSDDPMSIVSYYIAPPEGLTPYPLGTEMRTMIHGAVQSQITPDNIELIPNKPSNQA